jgi:hypothetical protein
MMLLSAVTGAADLDRAVLRHRASENLTASLQPGQSRSAIWEFTAPEDNGDVNCIRSVGDVDADGIPDVVFTVYDAGYDFDDLVCVAGSSQGTPTVLWSVDSQQGISGGGGYGPGCLATAADMNADDIPDVLYGTAWGGRSFYARSGVTGDSLWVLDTYDVPPSGWVYQVAPFVDITNDGVPEALAAVGADANSIFCVDGASAGAASIVWSFGADDGFMAVAVVGDVDGDNIPDVAAGNGANYEDDRVFCLHGAASWPGSREIWSVHMGGVVRTVAAMPDLNGDSIPEVLAGSSTGMVRCCSGVDGGPLWTRNVGDSIMKLSPLEDQNGDGVPEVAIGWWENAILCLNGSDGATLWSTPTGTVNGGDVWTVAAIDDLDGDGRQDVVAGSFDTKVYVVRGTDGAVLGTFAAGRRLYFVDSMPDVDGDELAEVLAGTQGLYGSLASGYCLSGGSFVPMQLRVSLQAGVLTLGWTPYPGAGAYWVFGAPDHPHFAPGQAPDFLHRVAVLRPNVSTWSTINGVCDPAVNWCYLVMAVNAADQELMRSPRVGEFDFATGVRWTIASTQEAN